MLRIRPLAIFHAALLGVSVLVVPTRAQGVAPRTTLSELPVPGGIPAALAAIGDDTAPDRATFLIEVIRPDVRHTVQPQERRERGGAPVAAGGVEGSRRARRAS